MANGQTPDMSALLGTLLSNPEALSGIMSVLKNSGISPNKPEKADFIVKDAKMNESEAASIQPVYEEEKKDFEKDDVANNEEKSEYKRKRPGKEDRERLLIALRPYLSKSRYDALDEIIKIAGILELFHKKGGR